MIGSIQAPGSSLVAALAATETRAAVGELLRGWVTERRWFPRRPLPVATVSLNAWVPVPGGDDLVIAVATVGYEDEHRTNLVIPLGAEAGASGLTLFDAADNSSALDRVAALLLSGVASEGPGATITSHVASADAICAGPARALAVEQSNTSFRVGEACIAKLFRVFQVGHNPDAELVGYLSGKGFEGVPRSIAVARLATVDGEGDLASVQSFVPNSGDGWAWALRRAEVAFANEDVGTSLVRDPETLPGARQLGQVTARLHTLLAQANAPGLAPRPATTDDLALLATAVVAEARETAALLPSRAAAVARGLRSLRPERLLSGDATARGMLTRVHGDYHLGQVLRTAEGWVIVDFEGEPARPLAERTALQSPLADVAGMLRSWDYAAMTAGRDHPQRAAWRDTVSRAFLDGYLETAERSPVAFLPTPAAAQAELLRLFVLRKALYEVRYELASRPDWVDIPLAAVEGMVKEFE